MMKLKLYHHWLMEQPELPPMPGPLVYVVAGNGLHLWAKREGLHALIPVAPATIRGLYPVGPFVQMDAPLLPASVLTELLVLARAARSKEGMPLESLYYPRYEPKEDWHLIVPAQVQSAARVRPQGTDTTMQEYSGAWFEVHSHHAMSAFFSATDDADEQGFRIYGVVGRIFSRPEIRLRVGIYGHYWEIPAHWVCMLPEGVVDASLQTDSLGEVEEGGVGDGNR